MGIIKKLKSAAKTTPAKIAIRGVKGALDARSAYKALGKGNIAKADAKQNSAMKGLLGKKAYAAVIKKEKSLIGEKNAKALDRVHRTGVALGGAAYLAGKGNLRGSKDSLGQAITIGVGQNNLRVAQHKGQDTIGKKNYNAIHKYGNRALNTYLDVGSAVGAAERGDYIGAAGYAGNAIRTGIGAEKLHQGKRALRDKIGQKNYDMLNNSYKAAKLGASIGKTASDLSSAHDAQKYMKVAMKAKKLYSQANEAHGLFKSIHSSAKAGNVAVGHDTATASEGRPMVTVTAPRKPIGGGGIKPIMVSAPPKAIGGGGKKPGMPTGGWAEQRK
jgi:hypothetical protein